jgi:hypothetical protein
MFAMSPSRLSSASVSTRSPCSSRATVPTRSRRPVTVRAVAEPERGDEGSRTASPAPTAPSVQLNKFLQVGVAGVDAVSQISSLQQHRTCAGAPQVLLGRVSAAAAAVLTRRCCPLHCSLHTLQSQRYEAPMLSSGVGAAVVTTWCVLRGQDPGTAASITVLATITAMVRWLKMLSPGLTWLAPLRCPWPAKPGSRTHRRPLLCICHPRPRLCRC